MLFFTQSIRRYYSYELYLPPLQKRSIYEGTIVSIELGTIPKSPNLPILFDSISTILSYFKSSTWSGVNNGRGNNIIKKAMDFDILEGTGSTIIFFLIVNDINYIISLKEYISFPPISNICLPLLSSTILAIALARSAT